MFFNDIYSRTYKIFTMAYKEVGVKVRWENRLLRHFNFDYHSHLPS